MQHGVISEYTSSQSWGILSSVEQSIKAKIEAIGTPLREWDVNIYRGVITGYNEAFIIPREVKDRLIAEDPNSAEIIRPILRGRDIKRYSYQFADLWVILAGFGSHKYLEEKYPAVYSHLCSYEDHLKNRGQCRYTSSGKTNADKPYPGQHHWLELDNNPSTEYLDDFRKHKIVYREISDAMDACIVEPDIYLNNKCYILTGDHLTFLLCVFNSLLFTKIILSNANLTGGKGCGFLGNVRIPIPDKETEARFEELYALLMEAKENEKQGVESLIDEAVFDLYNISEDEIKAICQ